MEQLKSILEISPETLHRRHRSLIGKTSKKKQQPLNHDRELNNEYFAGFFFLQAVSVELNKL